MRYVELNPVRAEMVSDPEEYQWSSYKANALGDDNIILTQHDEYLSLAKTSQERQTIYRSFVNDNISDHEKKQNIFRNSLQTGTPIGNEKFKHKIETMLNRKIGFTQRGRPRIEK